MRSGQTAGPVRNCFSLQAPSAGAVHVTGVEALTSDTARWSFDAVVATIGSGAGLVVDGEVVDAVVPGFVASQVDVTYDSAVVTPGAPWVATNPPGITFAGGGVLVPSSGFVT